MPADTWVDDHAGLPAQRRAFLSFGISTAGALKNRQKTLPLAVYAISKGPSQVPLSRTFLYVGGFQARRMIFPPQTGVKLIAATAATLQTQPQLTI